MFWLNGLAYLNPLSFCTLLRSLQILEVVVQKRDVRHNQPAKGMASQTLLGIQQLKVKQ